jgi:hypothetical protein
MGFEKMLRYFNAGFSVISRGNKKKSDSQNKKNEAIRQTP